MRELRDLEETKPPQDEMGARDAGPRNGPARQRHRDRRGDQSLVDDASADASEECEDSSEERAETTSHLMARMPPVAAGHASDGL